MALIGYARHSYGDSLTYQAIMVKAMKALNDPLFSPQVRTQGAVDKLVRAYSEFEYIPPENASKVDDLDRARLLIAFGLCQLDFGFSSRHLKEKLGQEYNIPEDELQRTWDWYQCKYIYCASISDIIFN